MTANQGRGQGEGESRDRQPAVPPLRRGIRWGDPVTRGGSAHMSAPKSPDRITVSVIQHRLRGHRPGDGRGDAAHLLLADPELEPRLLDRDLRRARAGSSPRPSTCRSTSARCRGRCASVADFFKGRIRPGDVFLLNDPYHGGNHLPDLTAFVPVFAGEQLRVLVDQPRAPERHRRGHPRRLQPRRHRDLAGGHPDHAAQALRARASCATTCMQMIVHQRASSARFPRRSRAP